MTKGDICGALLKGCTLFCERVKTKTTYLILRSLPTKLQYVFLLLFPGGFVLKPYNPQGIKTSMSIMEDIGGQAYAWNKTVWKTYETVFSLLLLRLRYVTQPMLFQWARQLWQSDQLLLLPVIKEYELNYRATSLN